MSSLLEKRKICTVDRAVAVNFCEERMTYPVRAIGIRQQRVAPAVRPKLQPRFPALLKAAVVMKLSHNAQDQSPH